MATRRIPYIDALRGLSIALVVYSHVLLFTFGNNKIFAAQLIATVMLPLFFFISGFVAYKAAGHWTPAQIVKTTARKFMALIIPATIFYCLFLLTMSEDIAGTFISHGFQRYWFPFALFGIFLIYYASSWLSRFFKSDKAHDIVLVIVPVVAFALLIKIFNIYWYQKYALSNVCLYLPFFVTGVLVRKHYSRVERLLSGSAVITVALIVFVASLLLCYHPGINQCVPHMLSWLLRLLVVRVAGVIIVFTIFMRSAAYFAGGSRMAKVMVHVGRRTLDIYLIHYFLLPDLTAYGSYFATNDTFILQVLIAAALAAIIIAGSMAISAVLRMSRLLRRYLLGDLTT